MEMPTRKSNKWKKTWVYEDFGNQLKSDAALEGLSLLEYTKRLAERRKKLEEEKRGETRKPLFFGL